MAKFYVESGSVQAVVDSVDCEGAALWVVNSVMGEMNSLDLFDDESMLLDPKDGDCHYLDSTIRVSEQGFGRENATIIQAEEAIQEWFELFQALSMMESSLLVADHEELEACLSS